jgi:hypothetical protein
MAIVPNPAQYGPRGARLPVNSTDTRLTVTVSSATTSYTLALEDANTAMTFDGTLTVLVPDNAVVAFPIGTQLVIINRGSGTIGIDAASTATLYSAGSVYDITASKGVASLIKTGADEWYLAGNLA